MSELQQKKSNNKNKNNEDEDYIIGSADEMDYGEI